MAARDEMTEALLTEHFHYTPLTLVDDIINTVIEVVYQALNNIEAALSNVPPEQLGFSATSEQANTAKEELEEALQTAALAEISDGIVKLESLLNATVDKDFDKLEIYTLRNLLTVSNAKDDENLAEWVVLDHYKDLQLPDHQSSLPSPRASPESLNALAAKVDETEKLNALLSAEQSRNNDMIKALRAATTSPTTQNHGEQAAAATEESDSAASFSFLTSTPSAAKLGLVANGAGERFVQNTRFTYSQLSSLREIVNTIRPHAETLKLGGLPKLQIDQHVEERMDYIESQARKAMERVGMEGTANGKWAGGEEQRRSREEVGALEGVVSALGGGRGGRVKEDADRMEE